MTTFQQVYIPSIFSHIESKGVFMSNKSYIYKMTFFWINLGFAKFFSPWYLCSPAILIIIFKRWEIFFLVKQGFYAFSQVFQLIRLTCGI